LKDGSVLSQPFEQCVEANVNMVVVDKDRFGAAVVLSGAPAHSFQVALAKRCAQCVFEGFTITLLGKFLKTLWACVLGPWTHAHSIVGCEQNPSVSPL